MKEVFYAGHLSPFKHVGHHPQFEHINVPPPGYRFVTSGQIKTGNYIRLAKSIVELSRNSLANGSTFNQLCRFIRSRSVKAQMRLPAADLVFLPSTPFILGQAPWVIEIEDTTTLFAPFPKINGRRIYPRLLGLDGVYDSGFFPSVKALLESDSCRGIICHVRSTADSIPVLFDNPGLSEKVSYIPLGVQPRPITGSRSQTGDTVTLLFTNSWHQGATGFYLRGGVDLLEAYSRLYAKHDRLRLILRSKLPKDLDQRYRRIIERCDVSVLDKFLPAEEMETLFATANIYVLPSARLHVVSLLQAMAHGLTIVTSDGWGIPEYVDHNRNGIIIPGRYGKVSWIDKKGMLREDFQLMFSPDANLITGLVAELSRLIDDEHARKRLGEAAKHDVSTKFSINNWNMGLTKAFDKALR